MFVNRLNTNWKGWKKRKLDNESATGPSSPHSTSSAQMVFVSSSPSNFPLNSHTLPLPSSTGEPFFFLGWHTPTVLSDSACIRPRPQQVELIVQVLSKEETTKNKPDTTAVPKPSYESYLTTSECGALQCAATSGCNHGCVVAILSDPCQVSRASDAKKKRIEPIGMRRLRSSCCKNVFSSSFQCQQTCEGSSNNDNSLHRDAVSGQVEGVRNAQCGLISCAPWTWSSTSQGHLSSILPGTCRATSKKCARPLLSSKFFVTRGKVNTMQFD